MNHGRCHCKDLYLILHSLQIILDSVFTFLIITCFDILVHSCHLQYFLKLTLIYWDMIYYEQLWLCAAIKANIIARLCPRKSGMYSKPNQESVNF